MKVEEHINFVIQLLLFFLKMFVMREKECEKKKSLQEREYFNMLLKIDME